MTVRIGHRALILLIVLITLFGCRQSLEQAVVGHYVFAIDDDGMSQQMKEASADGNKFLATMKLEVKADKSYFLTGLGEESKGNWRLTGDTITLSDADVDLVGKVTEGGEKIKILSLGGQPLTPGFNACLLKQ